MGAVEIDLGEGEVAFDHVERGVPEQFLEGVGVATVAQVLDGEGVAEAVRVDVSDAGAGSQGAEGLGERGGIDAAVVVGAEERFVGFGIGTGGQVAPERLRGAGRIRQGAFAGAFAHDLDALVAVVELVHLEPGQFADAHASVEQEQHDGAGAFGVNDGVIGAAFAFAFVGFGARDGGEHGFELGFGEGQDLALLGFGRCDGVDDVKRDDGLFDRPGPHGGKGGVVVQESAVGDTLTGCQEFFDLPAGDVFEGEIRLHPFREDAERILVVRDGMRGEMAGFAGNEIAGERLLEGQFVLGFHSHMAPGWIKSVSILQKVFLFFAYLVFFNPANQRTMWLSILVPPLFFVPPTR